MSQALTSVRPELVKGQSSFGAVFERGELCFDKLSTNGLEVFAHLMTVDA